MNSAVTDKPQSSQLNKGGECAATGGWSSSGIGLRMKVSTGLALAPIQGAVAAKSHRGCDLQQPTAL